MNDSLKELLIRHEGLSLMPYIDTVGKVTIGVGRNLTDNGISQDEAMTLFQNDVTEAIYQLAFFGTYDEWSEARQNAMVDMMFNLGPTRFGQFKNMIAAIKAGDWATAANEMLNSEWAQQVGSRAQEDAGMVRDG